MVFSVAVATSGVLPWRKLGGQKVRIVQLTADATYAQGGYAITATNCGMSIIQFVITSPSAVTGVGDVGWVPVWDATASKLKIYGAGTASGPLDEADTNEALLTGTVFTMFVIGY